MELPKQRDVETVALAGLEHFARCFEIPQEKANLAGILTSEAIINALEHAKTGRQVVKVQFILQKKRLRIVVRDFGGGFDVSETEKRIGARDQSAFAKRGWGLKLMRSMSDYFNIASDITGSTIEMHVNIK